MYFFTMTAAQQLLKDIRTRLTPVSGDLAGADAENIILSILDISKTQFHTNFSKNISDGDMGRIEEAVKRRLDGEPLQYIFGKAYFYDREFWVDDSVLIPRPDTETLIETILNTEKGEDAYFADIGTGSGIIPAILTGHRGGWAAVAIDISIKALRTAARNLRGEDAPLRGADKSLGGHVSTERRTPTGCEHIRLICSNMLTAIKPKHQFDFIVSNPPYISSSQIETLDKSVVKYEPGIALCGGEDGLDYYKMISKCARMYLKDNGRIYAEIGYDQGESVPRIFGDDGWKDIAVIKDLGGRDRVVRVL
jgi:release factor glutamine methyltransferase